MPETKSPASPVTLAPAPIPQPSTINSRIAKRRPQRWVFGGARMARLPGTMMPMMAHQRLALPSDAKSSPMTVTPLSHDGTAQVRGTAATVFSVISSPPEVNENQGDEPIGLEFFFDTEQPGAHFTSKVAVVGHTPQKTGEILDLGHLVCIDTYCQGGDWLTALDVDSGQYWQANEKGEVREGRLANAMDVAAAGGPGADPSATPWGRVDDENPRPPR
jgi:hypothetical protein